jgi:hypothetical protein
MKRAFLARGRDYLAQQKLEFLKTFIGTELEQAAITYAIQDSWILPIEPLDAVTPDKLFPSADLHNTARRVDDNVISDAEGSRVIRDAVRKDQARHVEKVREIAAKMGDKLTHAKPPIPNPDANETTLTGIPQALSKNVMSFYGFRIDGKDVYVPKDAAIMFGECVDQKKEVTITCSKPQWFAVTAARIDNSDYLTI